MPPAKPPVGGGRQLTMLKVLTLAPSSCCITRRRQADVGVNVNDNRVDASRVYDAVQRVHLDVSCVV